MTEAYYGTKTAEPAAAPAREAGDSPGHDETGLGTEYDGDLEALAAEDQLPARQDSRAATWGDNPEYDETALGAEYDGDLDALTAEDQLPARQDSRAATWGDNPGYYDETDLASEYDGDLDALTVEVRTVDTGDDHAVDGGKGDEDQAAAGEAPPGTGKPGDPPAEAPGISAAAAPEHEDGNVTAPESSTAGGPADTGSVAEADAVERPDEAPQAGQADALTGQAAQPDDGHADPGTAPDAGLKELKVEYEASLKELKAELQALKDSRQAAPDASGNTGREADQPRAGGLPVDRDNVEDAEHKDDRPGLWSNAKSALYGAVGSAMVAAAADQFVPNVPHSVVDIATGAVAAVGLVVPVVREGWKRKHDDSPD